MKKICLVLFVMLLLTGCSKTKVLETVSDVQSVPDPAPPQQVLLTLPQDAAAPVLESEEAGTLYLCDGYTVTLQTMEAGDLAKTLRTVTGFPKEELQLLETRRGDADRYDCVWTAAGDGGVRVCRASILDDGNYHYVLTAMADEVTAGALQSEFQSMFNSFRLVSSQRDLNTGS